MHYTDNWPDHAKEAFKERMVHEIHDQLKEQVKADIRQEWDGEHEIDIQHEIEEQMNERLEVEADNIDYWDVYSILDENFDEEIDKMKLDDQHNVSLKLLHTLTNQLIELTSVIFTLEERQRVIDYNLWQFKDMYGQKNGPFEHKVRKDWE